MAKSIIVQCINVSLMNYSPSNRKQQIGIPFTARRPVLPSSLSQEWIFSVKRNYCYIKI
tara:strand:- start:177 stop:353 length:177 start_codon:yes stop_codon:yes gene_type:complete